MMRRFMLGERTEVAKETTIEQADMARSNEDTCTMHPPVSVPLPAPAVQKDQDLTISPIRVLSTCRA